MTGLPCVRFVVEGREALGVGVVDSEGGVAPSGAEVTVALKANRVSLLPLAPFPGAAVAGTTGILGTTSGSGLACVTGLGLVRGAGTVVLTGVVPGLLRCETVVGKEAAAAGATSAIWTRGSGSRGCCDVSATEGVPSATDGRLADELASDAGLAGSVTEEDGTGTVVSGLEAGDAGVEESPADGVSPTCGAVTTEWALVLFGAGTFDCKTVLLAGHARAADLGCPAALGAATCFALEAGRLGRLSWGREMLAVALTKGGPEVDRPV